MAKTTLLGDEIKENFSMKKCCNECGFPVDMPRKPVLINDSILSLIEYNENVCKSCGHQKDGSTIFSVYDFWQNLVRKGIKQRDDIIKFFRHYQSLNEQERREVCVEIPRFMNKNFKSTGNEEQDNFPEPYSWSVVRIELINNTQLGRILVREIDWKKVENG